MAQAGGRHTHAHLAGPRRAHRNRLYDKAALAVANGGVALQSKGCGMGLGSNHLLLVQRDQITGFLRVAMGSPSRAPGHHWSRSLAWMGLSAGNRRMPASM